MTVLAAPSLSTTSLKDVTYGTTNYSQELKVEGGGKTSHKPSITEVSGLPSFLKYSSGKITGAFNTAAHLKKLKDMNTKENGFGSDKVVSAEITITLSCDIFKEVVTVSREINFVATAPKKVDVSKVTSKLSKEFPIGEAITTNLPITAEAPGTITWSFDRIPTGLKLSDGTNEISSNTDTLTPTKAGLTSTVKITGTPTEPVNGFKTKIRASNGAGYVDGEVTFKVSAPTPEIAYKTKNGENYTTIFTPTNEKVSPFSEDFKVGDTFDILVYNSATNSGATKFSANGLPSGITLKMSGDREATIKGTFRSATTSPATVEITAEDQGSSSKPKVTNKYTGVNVYTTPKISTSKLNDLNVGKFDIVTVTGTGVSKWYVSDTSVTSTDSLTAITTETNLNLTNSTTIQSADISTNSKGVNSGDVLYFTSIDTDTAISYSGKDVIIYDNITLKNMKDKEIWIQHY